jgi:hypothetical protein
MFVAAPAVSEVEREQERQRQQGAEEVVLLFSKTVV